MNAPRICWHASHENVFPALLYLVEWGDLRHAGVDRALRRVGGRGGVRHPLLPNEGRQDRSDARLRAPLGHLQRHCGSLGRAAVLAWLAAPHRRCSADSGTGHAAAVVEAASTQSHGLARRLSSDRLDPRTRAPPQGDRRLQGLAPPPLAGGSDQKPWAEDMRKISRETPACRPAPVPPNGPSPAVFSVLINEA